MTATLQMLEKVTYALQAMLDAQRKYFKEAYGTSLKSQLLEQSKEKEREVKELLKEVTLSPPDTPGKALIDTYHEAQTLLHWQHTFFISARDTNERRNALDKCRKELEPAMRRRIKSNLELIKSEQSPLLF